jgi:hypothetical protein
MKISKPNRVSRSFTQHLVAAPSAVFPLLCPVREGDWIEGWDPLMVISRSGVAEPDCVFLTAAAPEPAIWYVTRHDAARGMIEMLKISPRVTTCKLTIQLHPSAAGTDALICYTHTSLGPEGDVFVAAFSEDHYRQFMQDWEGRLNHYLRHGTALRGAVG